MILDVMEYLNLEELFAAAKSYPYFTELIGDYVDLTPFSTEMTDEKCVDFLQYLPKDLKSLNLSFAKINQNTVLLILGKFKELTQLGVLHVFFEKYILDMIFQIYPQIQFESNTLYQNLYPDKFCNLTSSKYLWKHPELITLVDRFQKFAIDNPRIITIDSVNGSFEISGSREIDYLVISPNESLETIVKLHTKYLMDKILFKTFKKIYLELGQTHHLVIDFHNRSHKMISWYQQKKDS